MGQFIHRTDSIRVSNVEIRIAADYVIEKCGDVSREAFKPRTWSVGRAHEAIRPTRPMDAEQLLRLVREKVSLAKAIDLASPTGIRLSV